MCRGSRAKDTGPHPRTLHTQADRSQNIFPRAGSSCAGCWGACSIDQKVLWPQGSTPSMRASQPPSTMLVRERVLAELMLCFREWRSCWNTWLLLDKRQPWHRALLTTLETLRHMMYDLCPHEIQTRWQMLALTQTPKHGMLYVCMLCYYALFLFQMRLSTPL